MSIDLFHVEFWIAREKLFSVSVKGWNREGFDFEANEKKESFFWNVYAYIYEDHPLFNEPEDAICNLPFNGGATYDKYIETAPSQGVRYDFEKIDKTLKIGSDYQHSWDDFENHQSPFEGIPNHIKKDALNLVERLQGYISEDEEADK